MPYFSSVERSGNVDEPDTVYYNADIINNNTSDFSTGLPAGNDPQIRFQETRDTAIIKDASKYEFSIVRFTMDGAGLDLPLFIPQVVLGQSDPTLTTYSVAVSLTQTYRFSDGSLKTFAENAFATPVLFSPETTSTVLAPVPQAPLVSQDLTSRYYWVYTYQHWVDLVNATIYNISNQYSPTTAWYKLWYLFQQDWLAYLTTRGLTVATDPFPYSTPNAMATSLFAPPELKYDATTGLFSWLGDERAFGTRVSTFTPAGGAGATTAPVASLWLNANLAGLLANFKMLIANVGLTVTTLSGYYASVQFPNKFYSNITDYTTTPLSTVTPTQLQAKYWVATQDYPSTGNLWSPISSIVFTSTLLPLKNENTAQPVIYGQGNLGLSAPTAQSAFQPIITDISLDTSAGSGSALYRQFIYYVPQAEYRMTAFEKSRQEIRTIDIQVYWKNRLNNQLYPVQMFNLSSVSLKILFRKRPVDLLSSY